MRLLYDTNVILDVMMQRHPFLIHSVQTLEFIYKNQTANGYIAAHAITTIDYIFQKKVGVQKSRFAIKQLLTQLHVSPVNDVIIQQALNSQFKDFEDAVAYFSAKAVNTDIIITRNIKDFDESKDITVLSPQQFIELNR